MAFFETLMIKRTISVEMIISLSRNSASNTMRSLDPAITRNNGCLGIMQSLDTDDITDLLHHELFSSQFGSLTLILLHGIDVLNLVLSTSPSCNPALSLIRNLFYCQKYIKH